MEPIILIVSLIAVVAIAVATGYSSGRLKSLKEVGEMYDYVMTLPRDTVENAGKVKAQLDVLGKLVDKY